MQFANAHLSWLLLLLPILAAICYRRRNLQQKLTLRFSESSVLDRMVQRPALGLPRIFRPDLLPLAVAALVVVSMLRPQWGFVWRKSSKSGVDLVIAVDVSESMLAKDITPSRLDRARHELSDLVERLQGDRVALVSFAGDAYIECPLTVDYNAFRLFLGSLDPNSISAKGTDIAAALEKSFDAFGRSARDDKRAKLGKGRTRAIVLITDGENFGGDLESVREQALRDGISIFVIGIGTPEGAPIPTGEGYKKDNKGHVVITRLNAEQLKQLAVETGGVYVQSISSNADTIAVYDKGIKRFVEASRVEWGRTKQWNDYYQFTALAAVLLLLAPSLLLGYSRLMQEKRSSASSPRAGSSLLLCAVLMLTARPLEAQSLKPREWIGAEAKEAYDKGKFEQALQTFSSAGEKWSEDFRLAIGKAASHYRLRQFEEAKAAFFESAQKSESSELKAQALYNAGNSLVQLGQYKDAIKAYEDSIKLNPNDKEARDNLEYVKRLLEQQQQDKDKENRSEKRDKQDSSEKQNQKDESSSSDSQQVDSKQDKSSEQRGDGQEQASPSPSPTEDKQNGEESSQSEQKQDSKEQAGEDRKESQEQSDGMSPANRRSESGITDMLESVDEDRGALYRYRSERASSSGRTPEQDW